MRGHAPWYIKGLQSSAQVKNHLTRIKSYHELEAIIEAYRIYLHTQDRTWLEKVIQNLNQ